MNTLSLTMIVKNEARCLARCLHNVQNFVDEMVIVDTGSTDDTVKIAEKFKAKVFHFDWTEDFAAARNFAITQATGKWILSLDADETVTPELGQEIRAFIENRSAVGRLRVVSDFRRNGQTMKSQAYVSRLFPAGARFEGRIHEQVVSDLPRLNLKGELSHDGYLETQKTDRNIKMLRAEIAQSPNNAYLLHQLSIEHVSLDQTTEAFLCLQQAAKYMQPNEPFAPNVVVDLIYASLKLKNFEPGLEIMKAMEKNLADFPDFFLARGLFYMELIRHDTPKYINDLPKVEQSYQRCLILGESEKYKSVHGTGSFLAAYNLGVFYHVLGNAAGARNCFEQAAACGYGPAQSMLQRVAA